MKYTEKQIQEWLFTDYIDGELDGEAVKAVEEYLQKHPDEALMVYDLKKQCVEPFSKIKYQEVPTEIWDSIKEKIEETPQQESKNVFSYWDNFLLNLRPFVIPTLAAVIIVIVSLTAVNKFNQKQAKNKTIEVQVDYLVLLADPEYEIEDDELIDPLEKYFF